ncbi:MAG: Hsp20/alpha crystallin family protein [Halobacteriota archaeon]
MVDFGDSYEITIDLPGYDKQHIDLTAEKSAIRVTAPAKSESIEGDVVTTERPREDIERTISLPQKIDPNHVSARYGDGVLTVTATKQ